MEKYETISVVGEGSYGLVMKCRHKDTDQIVAVKKFLETEEDATIRKMALREIRMLKRLKHENLVTMIEVFRYRKRFYLVFEFLEGTVLDELEKFPNGLGEERTRERIFQVVRAVSYCHSNNIIHRDVKPENVLVSSLGVVKLCDFGFARIISLGGEACTEYVATRWYRAPELLVGDSTYGPAVDVWAIGCLFAEMLCGDPIFPGESDIDQMYLIVKLLGKPCSRHQQLMSKSSQLRGMIKSPIESPGLYKNYPAWSLQAIEFLSSCIRMDPQQRLNSEELLKHSYFTHDRFPQKFLPALREKVNIEFNNPLLRKFKTEILMSTDKKDEMRTRRSFHSQDNSRWRFTLAEGSMKRKLSCDAVNTENLITLSKSSQRLNVMAQQGKTNQLLKQQNTIPNLVSKDKTKPNAISGNNTAEMQMLEKSLESLAKFTQKAGDIPINEKFGEGESPSSILPQSPQNFQINYGFGDFKSSPPGGGGNQQVLHPSINNISFSSGSNFINKDQPKRSPNVRNLNFNPVPTLVNNNNTNTNKFLKKLDRNVVIENIFDGTLNNNNSNNVSGNIWFNNFGTKKKMEVNKHRSDDFSLPNLPGVSSGSPSKSKKKSITDAEQTTSDIVTPAYRYKRSKRKRNTLDITLPLTVHDNRY